MLFPLQHLCLSHLFLNLHIKGTLPEVLVVVGVAGDLQVLHEVVVDDVGGDVGDAEHEEVNDLRLVREVE